MDHVSGTDGFELFLDLPVDRNRVHIGAMQLDHVSGNRPGFGPPGVSAPALGKADLLQDIGVGQGAPAQNKIHWRQVRFAAKAIPCS